MNTLREAAQQALEAMEYADACLKKQLTTKTKHEYAQDWLLEAGTALRAALAQQAEPPGCDHCNHPLYAATRCRVCGRVTA